MYLITYFTLFVQIFFRSKNVLMSLKNILILSSAQRLQKVVIELKLSIVSRVGKLVVIEMKFS